MWSRNKRHFSFTEWHPQMLAAGDGRPVPVVRSGLLLALLRIQRAPVMRDGLAETVFEGWDNEEHTASNHGS
jgi:hypothetical protein